MRKRRPATPRSGAALRFRLCLGCKARSLHNGVLAEVRLGLLFDGIHQIGVALTPQCEFHEPMPVEQHYQQRHLAEVVLRQF